MIAPSSTQVLAALTVSIGSLLCGLQLDVIAELAATTKADRRSNNIITPSQQNGMQIFMGILFGSFLAPFLADKYGRRWALIWGNVATILGAMAIGGNEQPTIRNVCLGMGISTMMSTTPTYLAEIASAPSRGFLSSFHVVSLTIGYYLSSLYSPATTIHAPNELHSAFYHIHYIPAVCVLSLILTVTTLPETPRWILWKGDAKKGLRQLAYFNNGLFEDTMHRSVQAEYTTIMRVRAVVPVDNTDTPIAGTPEAQPATVVEVHPAVRRGTGTDNMVELASKVLLVSWFHFVGRLCRHFVLNRDATITSIERARPDALMVIGMVTFATLIDDVGRRNYLTYGSGLCVALLAALSTYSSFGENLPLSRPYRAWTEHNFISMFFDIAGTTIGPTAWLVSAEVLPTKYRARGMGVITLFYFLSTGLIEATIRNLDISESGVLLSNFAVLLINVVITSMALPETSGKVLEVVEDEFRALANDQVVMPERVPKVQ